MSENERTVRKQGEAIRPKLNLQIAQALVKLLYGLTVTDGTELNSYDDRNFHIKVEEDYSNVNINALCPGGYVLKILNSLDSKHPDYVEAQNLMIIHLIKHGVCTPAPVKNVKGQLMSLERLPTGQIAQEDEATQEEHTDLYMVRLFEYIPGEVIRKFPFTSDLMYQSGVITGEIDHHLTTFSHPAHKIHRRHWHLTEVKHIRQYMPCLTEDKQRSLIEDVLSSFEENVLNKYDSFTSGTIHGDINDHNILVRFSSEGDVAQVVGMLDYGDSVYSCYIFEISILLSYVYMYSKPNVRLENLGHALAGYLSKFPLKPHDLNVLKECVCGRMAQSLLIGVSSALQDPSNAQYLLSTQKEGWCSLSELWSIPKDEFNVQLQKCMSDNYKIDVQIL